jgi:hypothetical protein
MKTNFKFKCFNCDEGWVRVPDAYGCTTWDHCMICDGSSFHDVSKEVYAVMIKDLAIYYSERNKILDRACDKPMGSSHVEDLKEIKILEDAITQRFETMGLDCPFNFSQYDVTTS